MCDAPGGGDRHEAKESPELDTRHREVHLWGISSPLETADSCRLHTFTWLRPPDDLRLLQNFTCVSLPEPLGGLCLVPETGCAYTWDICGKSVGRFAGFQLTGLFVSN